MEPGAELRAHLASCPECAAEVEELRAMARLMVEDSVATHPGEHFFTSLHGHIMDGLGEQHGQEDELLLEGGAEEQVAPSPAQARDPWAWLEPIRAWFTLKPTLAMGALVAAAIALLIVWPSGDDPSQPAGYEPSRSVMPSVALNDAEKAELKSLAASIQVDVTDEDEELYAAWDEEETSAAADPTDDPLWGEGVTGSVSGLSSQELEVVLAELNKSL
ncbi:MAG: hypothetical protein CMH57_13500 [Myxococcales bacterium]|nr:hypothetical protein [Myxococcales bacterium]